MSAPVSAAMAGRVGSRMGVHWRVAATVMMVIIPRVAPIVPPMSPVMADSVRNWAAMWVLDAPSDRRRPISGVRSITDTRVMLAIPTAPTARMRRPRARKSPLRSDWMAFLTSVGSPSAEIWMRVGSMGSRVAGVCGDEASCPDDGVDPHGAWCLEVVDGLGGSVREDDGVEM